jgi:hypothetical protein
MRTRWLVNLLLLILVIVLGILVHLELARQHELRALTGLLPDSIREISLERSDLPTIRLILGVDGWRMESPYRVSADAVRIGELVRIAATPVHRSLPKSAGSERLGLTTDSPRLTLNGLVMSFGDIDPIAQHRYVAIGEQVHLIGDGFRHHLIARAEDFVDRTLLPAGFNADGGILNGTALTPEQLKELDKLAAETVEPLGTELSGRLLSLESDDGTQRLRFLVSGDGLRWARLDLRLRYLLATPPPWAVAEAALDSGARDSKTGDPGF